MHRTDLAGLTDDALVSRLSTLCAEGHVLTARLIVHLIEVEERRLDLRAACTSMFDFCQRRLGMSEGAAFRRITAARLVKRFPALLPRIERGELHLSTLVLLRPHLTEASTLPPPLPNAPQVIELAVCGLHNLGFSKSDARRAVDHVSQRRVANGDALDVRDLLRGAIAALT